MDQQKEEEYLNNLYVTIYDRLHRLQAEESALLYMMENARQREAGIINAPQEHPSTNKNKFRLPGEESDEEAELDLEYEEEEEEEGDGEGEGEGDINIEQNQEEEEEEEEEDVDDDVARAALKNLLDSYQGDFQYQA
ncbi:hypothetical protein CONCODRAFT_16043 [Conidiobolus coronatus NRRL 28638]|uniref:Uncharacterized protein n=1 Tax=Conidiobolus coronatus (strain ATCC 28846 / CBS 209.66 / NRRL 28638) TaxID=796925 RepID=A0A137PC86_CONC2|nr:hypothetical protein CONCODRAFT_16043 [Conidiobolus coronatus NRRL 28638]|eukprot:KXN72617.1 hypothetical protein CONCODRAFT_16043 [Conidiobolus coronatus NRRL 28638]